MIGTEQKTFGLTISQSVRSTMSILVIEILTYKMRFLTTDFI